MIEMKVMGIALDTKTGSPIVVLNDISNRKALPIWIGSAEASSIIRKIENIEIVRPMTHDLMVNLIKALDYDLDRVEINDIEDDKSTYYASLVLKDKEGKEIFVDSRPSDAISVAIRIDAPIFVSSKVLASGAISCNAEKDEEEAEEFRNFVQSIKPSDFEKIFNKETESDQ